MTLSGTVGNTKSGVTNDQINPKQSKEESALVLRDAFLKKEINANSVKAMAISMTKILIELSKRDGKAKVISKIGSNAKNKREELQFEKVALMPLIGEWWHFIVSSKMIKKKKMLGMA